MSYLGYNFVIICVVCAYIYLCSYVGRDVDSYCSRKVVPHQMRIVL